MATSPENRPMKIQSAHFGTLLLERVKVMHNLREVVIFPTTLALPYSGEICTLNSDACYVLAGQ